MSGDVQPRKRKDKKKKKDELGVEEPRGTSAALGEGDVFMHSQSEHGTGGHWCAKVIFFSLLAVLITLVGLIILENRGLSELEANSVESRYSNVLEGWIEDAPDDDHHDEHTLELKHHDDDDGDHGSELEHDDHDDDDDNEADDGEDSDEDHDNNDENDEQENDEDGQENDEDEEEGDDSEEAADNDDNQASEEQNLGTADDDEDDEEHEEEEDNPNIEIEAIEREAIDENASVEDAAEDDADDKSDITEEASPNEEDSLEDDVEFLEPDELDELPIVEVISAPKGKPLAEVGETASEKPQDTLVDEEEYERQQEALRKEKEQASQSMWLKLTVGAALLVATHALLRRATASRETYEEDEQESREETPLSDRRMTLISEQVAPPTEDGGNSAEEWPGEPSDPFWGDQLDNADRDLRQGEWTAAEEKASAPGLRSSARARYIVARALDAAAEAKRDNQLLNRAVAAYLDLLKMNERLSDEKLLEVTNRTLDRIKFRGTYLNAEPIYKLLIRRFPDDPNYRNNLTVSFLMANRADLAEDVLKETLRLWPDDRFALAHHGFVLKTLHNRLEEAVEAFTKALEGDSGAANEPRFYYHLGDALLLLGRFSEAHEVHKRAAALGHFLSPNQRSLYNVDRLKSKPWWNVDQTPYSRLARALEKSWKEILKEGEEAKALYEKEKEGLKERGEWSQLDLFVRGREVPNRCSRAPVTCGIVKEEVAASGCRRGQIKFSSMEAGTHVRPHVGPTNCRLRMHLGLTNTKDTFIRVDQETRQWQTGKVLMFDDSFEHEVWHNGTGTRLVLIVDVWHPDLTPAERRQLPAI